MSMNRRVSICVFRPSWFAWSIVAALALLVQASGVTAQTAIPNVVAFVPSPQHSATLPTGQPVVSRYYLMFYQAGTAQPLLSVDLGKPSPQADGVIRVDFTTLIASWPLPGVQSEARVAAVGPDGTSLSNPSNAFLYNCTVSLSAAGQSIPASGGTGSVQVSAGTLCGWSASSDAAWLTLTSGTNGVATGSVVYSVAPHSGTESRTATLTIGGHGYSVVQAGASSQPNVAPTVRITQPVSGSSVRIAPPLRITAEASDADDGIANVQFYANGTLIQTVTSAPYTLKWKLPSAGTFSLTAVAQDRRGARTTSAPVVVTSK